MNQNLPPLPQGFQLESQPSAQTIPALPEGFVIEGQEPEDKSLWQKTKGSFNGNAEFENAGSFEDWQWTQPNFGLTSMSNFKTTLAGMFGNDEDKINSFIRNNPNMEVKQDKNGNAYFEDQGKKWYIDKPGLDAGDVADFAGEAATYVAGGLAAAPVKNLAGRVAATGAIEGGINAGNQKLAGRDKVDLGEVGLAAGGGALFQALTPAISKAWRSIKGLKVSDKEAGQELAKQLGLNIDEQQTIQLGNFAKNLDSSVDRKTIASHVELNQKPTRGTLTGSQDMLDEERMLRLSGADSVRSSLGNLENSNRDGLNRAMKDFQKNISGGKAQSESAIEAGSGIQQSLINAESKAKSAVNQAYGNIGNANVGTANLQQLPNRIKNALSKNNVIIDPDNVKKTNIALNDLQKNLEKIQGAKGVSFKAIEQQRRRINGLFANAKPEDKRALSIMMKEFDNTVAEAFEKELLSGSPDALKNLQEARGVAADYFNKFQSKGSIVQKWMNSKAGGKEITAGIMNLSGTAPKFAADSAKEYLNIVGRNTPDHNLLKELIVQQLTTGKKGDKLSQSLKTSLQNALRGDPELMSVVFNKKELGFMSRTLHFLENSSLKDGYARSSGTTERLIRWANRSVGNDIALSNIFNLMKRSFGIVTGTGAGKARRLPTQQLNTTGLSGFGAHGAESINQ